ncbi:thiolase-like protein [Anaeromyces robustus]|uniref:Thiolase-like protein n=1 Tax=Anaeromyces robustus TaxID=1754192 RepID=A0A1Y1WY70_9FUNG|nr:thiolase-like protein [Anaeromyces robustus]|eukprot:ORX78517.1 thiolase-like protein [Anaeromyces robustus]
MKFIPYKAINCGHLFRHFLYNRENLHPKVMVVAPLYHSLGSAWSIAQIMNTGSPLIFRTQKKYDIGFVAENILDDIIETRPDVIPLFPINFVEFKRLFDENHPKCEIWAKGISSLSRRCFLSAGAPPNYEVMCWFENKFKIPVNNVCGATEAGLFLYKDIDKPQVPGETNYVSRCPWIHFHMEHMSDDPNEGELYIYNPFGIYGYATKAKKGEFYESTLPKIRIDLEHDDLYKTINGLEYYKTNDIWRRSTVSGDYVYVARADDVINFSNGLKMNPLPFESTVTYECNDIKQCCLLLDDTQCEVVCFVEPEWSKIIMEDGKPFDTTINPESLSREDQNKLKKIAQSQVWDSIYQVLSRSAQNINNWAKQLTINNVYVVDYGKRFPTTDKGSLSRRVAKLEYSEVLKKISKLINGEIDSFDEDVKEENEKENEEEKEKEVIENNNTKEIQPKDSTTQKEIPKEQENENKKSQEEINEEIQEAIKLIYESIKEIVPSTPEFEEFNINAPFTIYSIDSIGTRKLTNILARRTGKPFTSSTLFNYGTTYDLAKYITGYTDKDKFGKDLIPKSIASNKKDSDSNKIAIIGMALRLPGAINNAKSFWMALAKGKDCVTTPVKDRKLHLGYVDKPSHLLGENEHNIPRCGCYDTRSNVAKPSEFDAEFFNCLPEEAMALDPRHRWILETSWEALENSGIAPNSLENTITGVFLGINDSHDYHDLMKENGITPPIAAHSTPSGIVGRLSYFYKLFGPSFTIDTACSTGASALHSACRSLQFGDCDLSIVSGVKYLYTSNDFHRTSIARMTSPKGRCATFDKDADGFAPGEGCVTFILKRYEDAIRDHDNILSVILGTSSGQSGIRQSISAPSSDGQVINLKRALHFAGVNPSDISFVETHGTGTPLGDAIEVNALNQVYKGTHTSENPLVIGSVKTNIGHTTEVAGLAGVAKVILSMQHKYIPKNLHFNTLNPEIDIESIPIQIATKTIPWENKNNKPRIAQVSSFGLQGSIVHIILQEYIPEKEQKEQNNEIEKIEKNKDSKEDHILTISAKSPLALLELSNNYLNVLESMEDNEENIENLCYTSNIGRQHFNYRMSAIGKNANELYEDLEQKIETFEQQQQQQQQQQISKNSQGITQNLEVYVENAKDIDISTKIFETVEKLVSTDNIFKQTFENCESEIQNIFENISFKETMDDTVCQLFILSFYYSLQQFNDSLIVKDNSSKVIYGGFGLGELVSIVIGGGLNITSAFTLIKLLSNNKINENEISSWYNNQEIPKFQRSVYISSLDKVFKNGDILSQKDILSIMENIYEIKDTSSFIENYGNKSNTMTLYSMTGHNEEIKKECNSKYPNLSITEFVESSTTEKSLINQFIMNEYNQGKTINWDIYNSRFETEEDHQKPLQKIELPNYPFQRSTYWPISLNN